MKTIQRIIFIGISFSNFTRSAFAVIDPGLDRIDDGLKGPNAGGDPISTIQEFIRWLLTFLGLVMVLMAMWGGFKILTSGSEDEGREAGKKIIINAVIGIVVIFFAWTLTNLLFKILSGEAFT